MNRFLSKTFLPVLALAVSLVISLSGQSGVSHCKPDQYND